MNPETVEIGDYSLSNVLFEAIRGLNLVEIYLREAREREDRNAVRWLEDTRKYYLQILGSAQEFVRDTNHTPVTCNQPADSADQMNENS